MPKRGRKLRKREIERIWEAYAEPDATIETVREDLGHSWHTVHKYLNADRERLGELDGVKEAQRLADWGNVERYAIAILLQRLVAEHQAGTAGTMNAKDLTTIAAIARDKLQLMTGRPTERRHDVVDHRVENLSDAALLDEARAAGLRIPAPVAARLMGPDGGVGTN